MFIGKIVSSSSHVEYVCQVYAAGESEALPQPADYGFGTFVAIEQADGGYLVGVISNTQLVNPEFGNLGPRLSTQEELAVFSPDYLVEKATLVSVTVLGAVPRDGEILQGVPPLAASLDARVRGLQADELIAFHGGERGLRLAYLPVLLATNDPLSAQLALQVIERLRRLFPQEAQRLAILATNLAWKYRVQPAG